MTSTQQFLLAICILIAAARLGALASRRLGQPPVLGELLAGVLLGPSLLDLFRLPWFTDPQLSASLMHLADLGVIFLMFLAGLEIDLGEMVRTGRASTLAAACGVAATVFLGAGAALLFGYPPPNAFFLGVVLSATSVGISAQTLRELGVLRRRESVALLGAAVIDDLFALLALSAFLALTGAAAGGGAGLVQVGLRLAAYLLVVGVAGFLLIPRLTEWVEKLAIGQGLTSFVIVVVLLFAWAAETVGGIAAITGAFLVGLAFGRSARRREIEHALTGMVYGLLTPLFFVSIGLAANLRALGASSWLFGLVLIAAVGMSKVMGSGLGAWWGGLTRGEAFRVGLGMISRGEVVLIVASVGLRLGLIGSAAFAVIVLVVLLTTVLTPLLLRWAFARQQPAAPAAARATPNQRMTAREAETDASATHRRD